MSEVLGVVGWRARFIIAGLLVLVINGAFVALVRNDPPSAWADHETSPPTTARTAPAGGLHHFENVRSIYRAPVFWLAAAGFSLFFFAQWAFLYHGPELLEHGGLTARDAALALGLAGGLGVVLRLASGAALDRIVRIELLAASVLGVMALALLALSFGIGVPSVATFALLWGVGSGIGPALEPMLVARLFGRQHYASVYGAMDGVDTVVSIPGPWLGGAVYDLFGSYLPVLMLYATAFVIGSLSFGMLSRLARFPQRVQRSGLHVTTPTLTGSQLNA
jgi:OFA family oxalate/formate antiporter-like MFS transporter